MANPIHCLRLLLAAGLLLVLAACSHSSDQPVLAHVPANTPFVFANLEPIKSGVLEAWLNRATTQIPSQVREFRQAADEMQDDAPHLAGLMNAVADEMDGKTMSQVLADTGVDLHGRFAGYALGLSPVLRGQLEDPDKFRAFIDRMAEAGDITLQSASTGEINYRHGDMPGTKLQLLFARHGDQFAIALLPADAPPALLHLAVGAKMPEQPDAVATRLEELAEERGYQAQGLGYVDTAQLLSDLASGEDALLKALLAATDSDSDEKALAEFNGPGCADDLKRIAARVPQASFGYTRLDAKHIAQRLDIDLAPDIISAFGQVRSPLPGLGEADSNAVVDVALALPLPAIREFWTAQANAVAARPFTCKPLTDLNQLFAKIGRQVPKSAIPPFGNLRGLRVIIDQLQPPAASGDMPEVQARAVIALTDPESVLAMGKAMLQPLNQLDLKPDGQPVALPGSLSQFTSEPVWLAMNKRAIAAGIGASQKDKLEAALNAASGEPGQLLSTRFDGATIASWIRTSGQLMASHVPAISATTANARENLRQSFESSAKAYEDMKRLDFHARMDTHGLVIESEARLK